MGAGKSLFTKFERGCNYTVLLLGQTGSGKTSLLNLIANYSGVLHILDEGVLSAGELHAFGQGRVTDLSVENALDDPLASKTSDARVYQLELASNWFFTIIDTPGFGESRGLDVDKQHVERIMACLKEKIQSINCVMLVMNGRESRMTTTMKYVLSQLTAVMPKAVLDHVVAVFTNTETKRKLNFAVSSLGEVGLNAPKFECVENPFGMVKDTTAAYGLNLPEDDREEMTGEIRKSLKALEQIGWLVHDMEPVPSMRFQELNAKREEIEALLANNLELIVEQERLVSDLQRHRQQIVSSGVASRLTRQVTRWVLKREMFSWSKYVCHVPDCHCNCATSNVISPFASLWCFFNEQSVCTTCGHIYAKHRVSCDGWKSEEITEEVDVGSTVDEAEENLQARIAGAAAQKLALAHELDMALEDYAKLGLRNAYLHLLRSQKAVLEERLAAMPEDETLKTLLDTLIKSLKEVEEAAESTCCICFVGVADTVLNCGHKTFCADCAQQVGTCPLCRQLVTSRAPISSAAASSSAAAQWLM